MKIHQTSSRRQTERKDAEKAAATMPKSAGVLGAGSESSRTRIAPAERRKLVAQAAYYRAERRGFAPGGEVQDWLEAEAEIGRLLDS